MSDVESLDAKMDGDRDATITVSGGHGPNFDDFDSIQSAREEYVEHRKDKVEPKQASQPEANGVKGKIPDGEERVEADKNVDTSPEKNLDKVEVKFLKAKLGEKELDIDPDMEIPVTVNGETQYRKLSELRNHEAGKVAWDKKFSQLDSEMKSREAKIQSKEEEFKEYLTERDALFQDIGKMHELIQQNKPYDAIEFLVAQSGGNKYAFKRALMQQLFPEFERVSQMTPEEMRAEIAEQDAEFLREQIKSSNERSKAEASQREAQQKIESLMKTKGVDQESYNESYNDLKALGRTDITPELVVGHAFMKPLVTRAETLIGAVHEPSVQNDDLVIEMATILAEDPSLTDEEATEILRDALGLGEKEKRVLEKAKETGMVRRAPENPGNYKYYGSSSPGDASHIESFSDYDEL